MHQKILDPILICDGPHPTTRVGADLFSGVLSIIRFRFPSVSSSSRLGWTLCAIGPDKRRYPSVAQMKLRSKFHIRVAS